jgi:hypothetical protein
MRRSGALVAIVLGAGAAALQPAAGAEPSSTESTRLVTVSVERSHSAAAATSHAGDSRIVDRRLVCATSQSGGIYEIEAQSFSGTRQGSRWARLPFAVVSTGDVAAAAEVLRNSLAWITAGRPHASTVLGDYFYPPRAVAYGTLALNRRNCRSSSARIPLTAAGLTGGAASRLGDVFDCGGPRRVLVHVRAVLATPGRLTGHGDFLVTTTPVREARIAVRTETGRPLAYATVAESGRSTLHTGRGCFPD